MASEWAPTGYGDIVFEDLFEIDGQGRVVLRLHVQPGAGRSELVGRHGDALKVRVATPPERGRANEECRRLLAEAFELKESAVVLVGGETSRTKRFSLTGVADAETGSVRLQRVLQPGSLRPSADHHGPAPHASRP